MSAGVLPHKHSGKHQARLAGCHRVLMELDPLSPYVSIGGVYTPCPFWHFLVRKTSNMCCFELVPFWGKRIQRNTESFWRLSNTYPQTGPSNPVLKGDFQWLLGLVSLSVSLVFPHPEKAFPCVLMVLSSRSFLEKKKTPKKKHVQ